MGYFVFLDAKDVGMAVSFEESGKGVWMMIVAAAALTIMVGVTTTTTAAAATAIATTTIAFTAATATAVVSMDSLKCCRKTSYIPADDEHCTSSCSCR